MQFTVDGQAVGPPDTTAPYTGTWDTTAFANGPHTVGARATNTAGSTPTPRRCR